MKLEIHTALHFVLALPAHRSHDDGHRQLGKIAFDELLEFKELGRDDTEKTYNKAMVALVLSAVRAFSVERDKVASIWKSIEAVKARREHLLEVIQSLSPLSAGNYWVKTLAVIGSAGWSFSQSAPEWTGVSGGFVVALACSLVGLAVLSSLLEYLTAYWFERKGPIERQESWATKTLGKYKEIAGEFIQDGLLVHARYYPDEHTIQGINISTEEGRQHLRELLVNTVFYH